MARKEYKTDVVLGHADEADGIEEYDNKLPNWWLGLFFITIIVGVWMLLDWHVIGSKSLADLYDDQISAADERYAGLAIEPPTEILLDEATIAAGAEIYTTNCVACHAADGTGGVGPDLTDTVWIHGGTPIEIASTIFNGVPEQGMIAWGPLIGPDDVAKVAAYVVNFGGATGVDDVSAVDGTDGEGSDEAIEPEGGDIDLDEGEPVEPGGAAGEPGVEVIDEAAETGGEVVDGAVETGGEVVDEAAETGNELIDQAAESGGEAVDDTADTEMPTVPPAPPGIGQ